MKNLQLAVLMVMALALSGCALAYKSSQVQKEVNKTTGAFDSSDAQANEAVAKVDGIMASLYSTGAKKTQSPYDELARITSELHQSHARLKKVRARYDQVREPLQKVLSSRGKITSREPEFKTVRNFGDLMKPIVADYEKEGKALQSKLNAFETVVRREKIVEVDVQALKKTIEDGVASVNGHLVALRADIEKRRKEAKGKHANALSSLEDDLNKIEVEVKGVQELEVKFRKEAGENAKIVLGPHLASHSVVAQFEKRKTAIQNLSNHFNETAKELK